MATYTVRTLNSTWTVIIMNKVGDHFKNECDCVFLDRQNKSSEVGKNYRCVAY